MRRYLTLEQDLVSLLRAKPYSSSRQVINHLTDGGRYSRQAVRNALKTLEGGRHHTQHRRRGRCVAGDQVTPRILGAVPAHGFVCERVNSDGTHDVLELAAWGWTEDGDLIPLPTTLGPDWTVRPATDQDAMSIRRTGARMSQRPQVGPFGAIAEPRVEDHT